MYGLSQNSILTSGSVVGIASRFSLSSNSFHIVLSKVSVIRVSVCTGKLQRPKSHSKPSGILYSFFLKE